jgi:putative hemolysin
MTTLWVIGLIVLLLGSAFFSSAETAFFSLSTLQLRRMERNCPQATSRLRQLLDNPTQLLSTILIGNTVANVGAASLAFVIADDLFPSFGEILAIPVMTVLLLTLGEVAPKRLAMSKAERLAILYQPALTILIRVLTPVRRMLEWITQHLEKHLSGGPKTLTEDEFRTVVEVGEEQGILDAQEQLMVDGIIRLEEIQASDIMTPRVDLIGIDLDDPMEENRQLARQQRFRYLPFYRGSLDTPEGFLDVPKFLLSGNEDLSAATIPSFFVPETAPLDSLLATMQKEHKRVAFVADEYGGTAGLITRGDILEEIVPDVDNEYGEKAESIFEVRPGIWQIDGSTSLEDINYKLDTSLEAEGVDRISGWISAQVERIPRAGDTIEAQGCRATVQRVRRTRILLVMLEKLPESRNMRTEENDD